MERSKTPRDDRPLTREESKRALEGHSRETIAKDTFWRMRPDGIAGLPPIGNKAGVFCILDYKHMLDITDQYLIRAKSTAENQYASLRSAFSDAIHRH